MDGHLTLNQLAERFRVSRDLVRRVLEDGKLEPKRLGRRMFWPEDEAVKLMKGAARGRNCLQMRAGR